MTPVDTPITVVNRSNNIASFPKLPITAFPKIAHNTNDATMVVGTDFLTNPILIAIKLRPFTQIARTTIVLIMDINNSNDSESSTIGEKDSVIANIRMGGMLHNIMDVVVNKATSPTFARRTFFRLSG